MRWGGRERPSDGDVVVGGNYDSHNNLINYQELTRQEQGDTYTTWQTTSDQYMKNPYWTGV